MAAVRQRIVFMGTPRFAVPVLGRLIADGYDIPLVVTQPDRRKGRHGAMIPPPVKEAAQEAGLEVFQPVTLRDESVVETIQGSRPDIIVVAAYGEILPLSLLGAPQFGCLNVHASLLPRYRGASPVAASILAGDSETGVTIMSMDQGLDTGAILAQAPETIRTWDTQESLTSRLAELGANLLSQTIPHWVSGGIVPAIQDEALSCHTSLVKKSDGRIQWGLPANHIERMVRAYTPWPLAHTYWKDKQVSILLSSACGTRSAAIPGTVIGVDDASIETQDGPIIQPCIHVATGDGVLAIARLQIAGGRPMPAERFLRGHSSIVGALLGGEIS